MSVELLDSLKQQATDLTPQEKAMFAGFLLQEAEQQQSVNGRARDDDPKELERRQHMDWLKANRETYAGQYVALDGDRLVGQGRTIREAHEQAKSNGVQRPFLVRVTSENEDLFGGW